MTTKISGDNGIEFPDATQQDTRGVPNGRDYAQGYLTSNVNINPDVITTIPFNAMQFDPSGMWDNTNKRLTPKAPGLYSVTLTVTSSHPDQFAMITAIQKNGVGVARVQRNHHAGDNGLGLITLTGTVLVELNGDTDYLGFTAYGAGGSGQITLHSGTSEDGLQTLFSVYLVRAL